MRNQHLDLPGFTPRNEQQEAWRWQVHKCMLSGGAHREALEFIDCQNPSTFHAVKVCPENHEHYAKAVTDTCHNRVCPECATREASRIVARYKPHIEEALRNGPKAYTLRHITLTTKYSLYSPTAREDMREARRKVNLWLDRMLGKGWHKTGQGVLIGLEYGPQGKLLHFHILHYGRFIQQAIGAQVWEELTGFTVVDIRKANIENGLRYIVKYVSKIAHLSPQDTYLLSTIIKGARRVWSRGRFFRVSLVKLAACCPVCGTELEKWSVGQWNHFRATLNLNYGNNSGNKSPPQWQQMPLWKAER